MGAIKRPTKTENKMSTYRKNKYTPKPAYFHCYERAETVAVGNKNNWTFVYAATAPLAEDTTTKESTGGVNWRAVGFGETLDEAREAAIEAAEKLAPAHAVQKMHDARGRRADRQNYLEMSKEERDAHNNL